MQYCFYICLLKKFEIKVIVFAYALNNFRTTIIYYTRRILLNKTAQSKNIIFVRAFHIDPEPRLLKAAKWLKESFPNCEVSAFGWDRTGQSTKKEVVSNIKIERMFFRGEYGGGIKKNIVGLILFNLFLLYKFLAEKVDVIHACDLDTAIPAIIVSKLKGIKMVYDIYDFYSDTRALGMFDSFIRKLELWIIRQADVVIIADERRIKQLGKINNEILKKIIVIYNTPEEINFIDNPKEDSLISYVGVLTKDRRLIEAVEIIKNMNLAKITLAGYGVLEKEINNISNKYGDIIYLGKVSYEQALMIQYNSVAILAMYDPKIANNRYAAPNKLCEAMMLGKPIITSDGTFCADIVREEGIGFVIPHEDYNLMRETFLFIDENRDIVEHMGIKSRRLYDSQYSALKMKERIKNMYCKLLTN